MPPELFLDSDVILKLCIYRLEVWKTGGALAQSRLTALTTSRFVIPKRIGKARTAGPKNAVTAAWESFVAVAAFVEPSEAELAVAAELEAFAQRNGAAFDVGESQLLAILVGRNHGLLVTGDKRALLALGELRAIHGAAAKAEHRVACLEQLIAAVVAHHGGDVVREAICSEPAADKALAICFRCASGPAETGGGYTDGLDSYVNHIRDRSGGVIVEGSLYVSEPASAGSSQEDSVGISQLGDQADR